MKQMRRTVLTLFVALMSLASAVAQTLRVPTIIGDNMVLQRNTTAHLWGWANAGEDSLRGTLIQKLKDAHDSADEVSAKQIELAAEIAQKLLDGREVTLP